MLRLKAILLVLALLVVAGDGFSQAAAPDGRPLITGLSPTSGAAVGGAKLTITGRGFTPDSIVTFDGMAAQTKVLSPTRVQATTPIHAAGSVQIQVRNGNGSSPIEGGRRFEYLPPPLIGSMSPEVGAIGGGAVVTLTGLHLAEVTQVTFDGVPGSELRVWSDRKIQVTSPAHAVADAEVAVVTFDLVRTIVPRRFSFGSAPKVTSISPATGPVGGGVSVIVVGAGFLTVSKVSFGSTPAAYTVDSPTQLTVIAPAHAAGLVDIRVETLFGRSPTSSATRFTYGVAPSVLGIDPAQGPTTGGASVTVTGSGFSAVTAVMFGSAPATGFTVVSATSLTAVAPAQSAGPVDVLVGNAFGLSGAGVQFTYTDAPTHHCAETVTGAAVWETGSIHLLDCALTVAAGGSLTLDPGVVVKSNTGAGIDVFGSLIVAGSPAQPVTFTSSADDSVAGDSNGDGSATDPSSQLVNRHVTVKPGGHLTAQHARFDHAWSAAQTSFGSMNGGTVAITDSWFGAPLAMIGLTAGSLQLHRNTFAMRPSSGSVPMPLALNGCELSGVTLAGADRNIFVGSGIGLVIDLSRNYVDDPGGWTMSSVGGGVIHQDGTDVISSLAIAAGTVVKNHGTVGMTVHGTLTVANGAVFTNFADDTVGGDSNGDGAATDPSADYILLAGVQIVVAPGAHVTVAGARFDHSYPAMLADSVMMGQATVTVTDSHFASPIGSSGLGEGALQMQRNTFDMRMIPARVGLPGSTPSMPVPLNLFGCELSGVIFAGPDRNTFLGAGPARLVVLSRTEVKSAGWVISGEGGAVFYQYDLVIVGSATVTAGTILKSSGGLGSTNLKVQGSLTVAGTAANPVVFTSFADDSAGGDTNGDGAAGDPATDVNLHAGSQILFVDGSHLTVAHAVFRYGVYGVQSTDALDLTATVTITDSHFTIPARFTGLANTGAVLLHRNTFEAPTSFYACELSGFTTTGADRNLFVGAGRLVVLTYDLVNAPSGWVMSSDGGAVFLVYAMQVDTGLTVGPGTIVKSHSGAGATAITVLGHLTIAGTPSSPAVFTSHLDDFVGGDTNGDGNATAPSISDAGTMIRIATAGGLTSITGAVFRYTLTAISVGNLNALVVSHTQFAFTQEAFDVDTTSEIDPTLAALPCLPPYTSFITGFGNWFGGHGIPGAAIDLTDFLGFVPVGGFGYQALWDYFAAYMVPELNLYLGRNTIPWAMYNCPSSLGDPTDPTSPSFNFVPFPTTPVRMALALSAPYPQLAEQA